MPTVVREDGFSIQVYAPPREHPPPHVHVHKAGTRVVIELGIAGGVPSVRNVYGMAQRHVLEALRLVEQHQATLMTKWEEMHGYRTSD